MSVTITEQLTKLNQLRQQLAANLTTKGVPATATEKFKATPHNCQTSKNMI